MVSETVAKMGTRETGEEQEEDVLTLGLLEAGDLVVGAEAVECAHEAGLAPGQSSEGQGTGGGQALQLEHLL